MSGLRALGVRLSAALSFWLCAGAAWASSAPAAVTAQQMSILTGLGWLIALLILVGAAVIINLQRSARSLADASDAARERYYALPFGVPDGTVRGLVSIFVIVLGVAVLAVAGPLGVDSTEAITAFVSAVIAFYFVTREQDQNRAVLNNSINALQAAAQQLQTANAQIAQAASNVGAPMRKPGGGKIAGAPAPAIEPNDLALLVRDAVFAVFGERFGDDFDEETELGDDGFGFTDEYILIVYIDKIRERLKRDPRLGAISLLPVKRKADEILGGAVKDLIKAIVAAILKG